MVTQERLKEVLEYNPENGRLHWKVKRSNIPIGTPAGARDRGKYMRLRVDGRFYMAHRLVWLMFHGEWPKYQIDHINGDKVDNRIENLRDVPGGMNMENLRAPLRRNKCGFLGVYKSKNRYRADLTVKGKTKHIGSFKTPEEAHAAYIEAKRKLHAGCTI